MRDFTKHEERDEKAMKAMSRRAFVELAGSGAASLLLSACGGSNAKGPEGAETTEGAVSAGEDTTNEVTASGDGSAVVAWFSWSGNTAGIAERIVGATGAQAFEIVPEEPYPEAYDDCTDVALQEQRDGVMPAYQGDVGGWDGVSIVYLGYPIWWMDLPQVIKSFIADHDWAGKTVVPFSTYYSSGWAGTPDKIADTCTGATVADGLSLGQNDLPGAYDQVEGWLEGLAL